jgi:hypothetical protein
MNGLLAPVPSGSSIRLVLSGFLLLLAQAVLVVAAPQSLPDLQMLTRFLVFLACACLAGALAGVPEPAPRDWRSRHVR